MFHALTQMFFTMDYHLSNEQRQLDYESRNLDALAAMGTGPLEEIQQSHIEALQRKTHHLFADATLIHALRGGKVLVDKLLWATKFLVKQHYITLDQQGRLYPEVLRQTLEAGEYDYNKIVLPTLRWRRGSYLVVETHVTYGNCPDCFKPGPLGMQCTRCPAIENNKCVIIYMPHHSASFQNDMDATLFDKDEGPAYLAEQGIAPINAMAAGELVNIAPEVHLDGRYYLQGHTSCIPAPTPVSHWCIRDMYDLFRAMLASRSPELDNEYLLGKLEYVSGMSQDETWNQMHSGGAWIFTQDQWRVHVEHHDQVLAMHAARVALEEQLGSLLE